VSCETREATVIANREQQEQAKAALMAQLRAIAADIRAALGDDPPTSDHSWLYDDKIGLPR
jgi:hypothetical protein